jgi:hypothetical protein
MRGHMSSSPPLYVESRLPQKAPASQSELIESAGDLYANFHNKRASDWLIHNIIVGPRKAQGKAYPEHHIDRMPEIEC